MKALFDSIRLGRKDVKNRIAKSATAETRGSVDGYITESYLDYYRSFAKGGVGLIHTGFVYTMEKGKTTPNQVGLDNDDKIPGFKQLAKVAHEHDCLIIAQLHHPGRNLIPIPGHSDASQVVAPSPVRHLVSWLKPRELTVQEIEEIVSSWAEAAGRAEEAEMDGVQVHVAHGYLLHSFVSPRTNRREDEYGGSLDGRLKIVQDVISAIRKKTSADFLVTVKLNGADGLPPGGLSPSSAAEVAERLSMMEIDALEVSSGTYEYPSTTRGSFPLALGVKEGSGQYLPLPVKLASKPAGPVLGVLFGYKEGFNMKAVRMIRSRTDKPIICLGGFKTPEVMAGIIERGEGHIISMGRQLIADPEFPNKIRSGETITACTFCNKCIMLAGFKPAQCYQDLDHRTVSPPTDGAIK